MILLGRILMKTMLRLIILVLMLGGWGLSALALHVVRTPEKIAVIPKNQLGLTDTYVDTRAWTLAEAANHGTVIHRLIDLHKEDLLVHVIADSKSHDDLKTQLIDSVNSAPAPNQTTQPTTTMSKAVEVVHQVQ